MCFPLSRFRVSIFGGNVILVLSSSVNQTQLLSGKAWFLCTHILIQCHCPLPWIPRFYSTRASPRSCSRVTPVLSLVWSLYPGGPPISPPFWCERHFPGSGHTQSCQYTRSCASQPSVLHSDPSLRCLHSPRPGEHTSMVPRFPVVM